MKILVLGAAGRLGQQLVIEALDQGHEVTAFVRNPATLAKRHDRVKIFQGDALDAKAIEKAIAGQDAIVSALGVGSSRNSGRLMERSMPIIAHAMERQGVRRLVFTSGINRKLDQVGFLPRMIMKLMLSDQIRDKGAGEELLNKKHQR